MSLHHSILFSCENQAGSHSVLKANQLLNLQAHPKTSYSQMPAQTATVLGLSTTTRKALTPFESIGTAGTLETSISVWRSDCGHTQVHDESNRMLLYAK